MEYIEKDLKHTKWIQAQIEDSNSGEYELIFRITDSSIDYHEEIVDPNGISFAKNVSILALHNHEILAPAKLLWVKKDGNSWIAKFRFDINDPYSILLYNKYKNGFMTDVSIGFMTNPEKKYVNENGILVHGEITVYEISFVNVGANENAHILSIEDCELIIKSATNPRVKQDFVNIKNQKIMEDNFEKINKRLDEIISRIDTAETNIKDIINNKSFDIEEMEIIDEPEVIEEKEVEIKDEMDPETKAKLELLIKKLNSKVEKLEKII